MAHRPGIAQKIFKPVALAAARTLLRPRPAPPPAPGDVSKVLVVKLWALGEYLMATPAYAALRDLYPRARITLMTGTAAAPLAAHAPYFDRVWTVPEDIFVRRRWAKVDRLRRLVAREEFDLAVVFHHAWEFAVFAAAARIPHRVGFDRAGDGFAHTVKVPYGLRAHQVEEYFDLARACGAGGEPGPMTLFPGDEAEAEAEHLAAQVASAGKPLVLVAPGGGVNPKTRMEYKRWPAENYAALVGKLSGRYAVAIVGSPSDREVNGRVAAATGVPDLTGLTSLPALYVLLKNARAFIGNDSAPMHLAAAAGTPTVAFFGPTNPTLNGPWRTKTLVLQRPMPCQPCYRDGYFPPCDHRSCLTNLTADDAWARIDVFLDTSAGAC